MKINTDVAERIKDIVQENPLYYQEKTGNDAKYAEFLARFPKEKINQLTIDQYCLGDPENFPSNFCWWIEKNLNDTLGRYYLGNASGHLIYKRKKDKEVQKVKVLDGLSDEEAMVRVAQLHHQVANSNPNDISLLDDLALIADAGLDRSLLMGNARKLRLLNLYNPDHFPIVNSSFHIRQILLFLGASPEEMPSEKNAIALAELLRRYHLAIQEEIGIKISPYHFAKLFYKEGERLGLTIQKREDYSSMEGEMFTTETEEERIPINQIFYGPPGTGKTYRTVEMAVKITDPNWYQDWIDSGRTRAKLKERYDELVFRKQISFVTFHQSFSYEDFIEGIRAGVDEEKGLLNYNVDDGVFKKIVAIANQDNATILDDGNNITGLDARTVWKMSLGNTQNEERYIYDECIENNYIALGYGEDIDFDGFNNRSQIRDKYAKETGESYDSYTFKVNAVDTFKNEIRIGDIVIISDGNYKFRAIGEIIGDYKFLKTDERSHYRQTRDVKWHKVFEESLPAELIINKSFSQMALYKLSNSIIKESNLKEYLLPKKAITDAGKKNYALIIDEINRGNIASIFGELITLIEPNKRLGEKDAQSTTLPYSKKTFSVPNNLYLIGAMNTSDHSLISIDIALRRRFEFIEMMPDYTLLQDIEIYGVNISELLEVINQRIEVLLGRDFVIGHSYFIPLKELDEDEREKRLGEIFEYQIIPLLQEYFYEDWERIQWVLNDQNKQDSSNQFIQLLGMGKQADKSLVGIFPKELIDDMGLIDRRYKISRTAFKQGDAYRQILLKLQERN